VLDERAVDRLHGVMGCQVLLAQPPGPPNGVRPLLAGPDHPHSRSRVVATIREPCLRRAIEFAHPLRAELLWAAAGV